MTRQEELEVINQAIEAGKLRRIAYSYEPIVTKPRGADVGQQNAANAAKNRDYKRKERERQYKELGLI